MQILELQIKNFGKFSNHTITFHEGVNIIYGENEMGKTTIHAFIRGMLFGIEKMRGRASKNDEYSLREPWDNPGYYAGIIRFRSGGKVFRIERSFSKTEKKAELICETDGEELNIEQGDLQMLLEGLNESAFRNTVYVRQKSSETDEGLAAELQNYMANCESSGDDEINVTKAIESLKEKQKGWEQFKRQKDTLRTEQIQEIQMKMDYVEQEINMLQIQHQEGSRQVQQMQVKEQQEREARLKFAQQESLPDKKYRRLQLFMVVLAFASVFIIIFNTPLLIKLAAGVLVLGLAIACCYIERMIRTSKKQLYELKEMLKNKQNPSQKLAWSLERIREDLHEKQVVFDNLKESYQDAREEAAKPDKVNIEIEALNLAIVTMNHISSEIYKDSARKLNQTASDILNKITGGSYTSIYLDNKMQVRINTPRKLLYLEQVSRGTMDQIYFALRMAAAQMFCEGEKMPLILDDAFVMYDEKRLKNTLGWLKNSNTQVLLFTCHKREERLMEELEHEDGTMIWSECN